MRARKVRNPKGLQRSAFRKKVGGDHAAASVGGRSELAARAKERRRRGRLLVSLWEVELVFVDVDGVLLCFDDLINRLLVAEGLAPISKELLEGRPHDYLSEAFPHMFTRDEELRIVRAVFTGGHLRDQPGYDFLDVERLAGLLSHERVRILTRIPPGYDADRLTGLKKVYGTDLSERFLSMWDGTTKGEVMARICAERGVAMENAVLIDDRHDNLEGALKLGARGVLVQQSYNLAHVENLKKTFGPMFAAVEHASLPATLAILLKSNQENGQ